MLPARLSFESVIFVRPGLVPGIHVLNSLSASKTWGRVKPGHVGVSGMTTMDEI
jgi:hypothetical protein